MNARRIWRARGTGVSARVALGLYPPTWRIRYGDEVRALLEDSGAGVRATAWSIPGFVHTWFCVTQLRQVALL